MPLDSIASVPPQVTYENNQLTIVASNSTLADVLRAVRKTTGADIDVPAAPERVVTHLGPGPARDVRPTHQPDRASTMSCSALRATTLPGPGVVLVAKTEGARSPREPVTAGGPARDGHGSGRPWVCSLRRASCRPMSMTRP